MTLLILARAPNPGAAAAIQTQEYDSLGSCQSAGEVWQDSVRAYRLGPVIAIVQCKRK